MFTGQVLIDILKEIPKGAILKADITRWGIVRKDFGILITIPVHWEEGSNEKSEYVMIKRNFAQLGSKSF